MLYVRKKAQFRASHLHCATQNGVKLFLKSLQFGCKLVVEFLGYLQFKFSLCVVIKIVEIKNLKTKRQFIQRLHYFELETDPVNEGL